MVFQPTGADYWVLKVYGTNVPTENAMIAITLPQSSDFNAEYQMNAAYSQQVSDDGAPYVKFTISASDADTINTQMEQLALSAIQSQSGGLSVDEIQVDNDGSNNVTEIRMNGALELVA